MSKELTPKEREEYTQLREFIRMACDGHRRADVVNIACELIAENILDLPQAQQAKATKTAHWAIDSLIKLGEESVH